MKGDGYTEYEEVLSTQNAGDQAFIKSLLDAEGITYYIQGEYAAPYLYHALPLRVMVRRSEAEKARAILKDAELAYHYGGGKTEEDLEREVGFDGEGKD